MKRQVLKIDENLIDYTKSAAWNVWRQFGVDIDTYKGEAINVSCYYMPYEEQSKIRDILLKKGKLYKTLHKITPISLEMLDYFPSPVLEGKDYQKALAEDAAKNINR